jgi:crotonobetainyl-CoA:carnitine CoA-transferase CaiB-like acyl-CoA transferase
MIFTMEVGDTSVKVVAGPASFDGHAAPAKPAGSPGMGEHTDMLLTGIGYSADALSDLKARKIVQ